MTTAYIDQQKELIRAVKEKHSEVVQRLLEVSPDLIVGHDCVRMKLTTFRHCLLTCIHFVVCLLINIR